MTTLTLKNIAFTASLAALSLVAAAQDVSQTSPTPPIPPPARSGAKPSPSEASAAAQREAGGPRVDTSTAATPSPAAAPEAASAAKSSTASPKSPAKPGKNAADRLDLTTTTITGNRELPKVMYVVPWKKADIGDLIGRPANSLLDEVLAPVDRDVFRREVVYYQALNPDGPPKQP